MRSWDIDLKCLVKRITTSNVSEILCVGSGHDRIRDMERIESNNNICTVLRMLSMVALCHVTGYYYNYCFTIPKTIFMECYVSVS